MKCYGIPHEAATLTEQHFSEPLGREQFKHFLHISTRWMDNDIYGHVNNVVYYSYFDTVINQYLIRQGGLDIQHAEIVAYAAESWCQYRAPIRFPQSVYAGLRVARLGNSSVRYEIALFADQAHQAAAVGYFVHVFVKRANGKSTPIPKPLRAALNALLID